MAVPLAVAGLRGVLWLLLGVAGLALTAVGLWWTLAHTGVLRARVPRHRPGTRARRPAAHWPHVTRLALGRPG
jgi:hypothetical protein